jgi:hypothetical protein
MLQVFTVCSLTEFSQRRLPSSDAAVCYPFIAVVEPSLELTALRFERLSIGGSEATTTAGFGRMSRNA